MVKTIRTVSIVEVNLIGAVSPTRTAEVSRLTQMANTLGAITMYSQELKDRAVIGFSNESPETLAIMLEN